MNPDDYAVNFRDVAIGARFAATGDGRAKNRQNLKEIMEEPYFKHLPTCAVKLLVFAYNTASEEQTNRYD